MHLPLHRITKENSYDEVIHYLLVRYIVNTNKKKLIIKTKSELEMA